VPGPKVDCKARYVLLGHWLEQSPKRGGRLSEASETESLSTAPSNNSNTTQLAAATSDATAKATVTFAVYVAMDLYPKSARDERCSVPTQACVASTSTDHVISASSMSRRRYLVLLSISAQNGVCNGHSATMNRVGDPVSKQKLQHGNAQPKDLDDNVCKRISSGPCTLRHQATQGATESHPV
jgi:hypothetical protein